MRGREGRMDLKGVGEVCGRWKLNLKVCGSGGQIKGEESVGCVREGCGESGRYGEGRGEEVSWKRWKRFVGDGSRKKWLKVWGKGVRGRVLVVRGKDVERLVRGS